MNSMNFMEKLLDGVGVEWKFISDIFHLKNGYTPSKSINEYWMNGTIHWFRMDDIRENGQILGDSLQKVSASAVKGGKLFPANSIIISTSATIGEHALITVPHLANQRFTCLALKSAHIDSFDIKFLFYYCFLLADWCKKNTTMSSFASVDMDGFRKFQIPIPCPENPKKSLEIQAEIVRILDAFTSLTAELTAELTARKKQYNYYRDQLLSFEDGEVEWKTLGELCVIGDGLHGTPKYDDNGEYFFINGNNLDNGNIVFNDKTKKVNNSMFKKHGIIFTAENTVFLSINGTIGSVSFYNNEKIVLGKSVSFFNIKSSELYSRYLFYFLQTDFSKKYFEAQKTGSTIKNLGLKALRSFEIPLPTYAEQARIVAILDKFDALTTSISEGLPREIALRQKQYEYYRDLLLSFPKPEASAVAST